MVIVTADELLEMKIKDVDYIVEGIIHEGGLVYCFGESGTFKSNFMIYTCLCCAKGINVLDKYKTKPCKTMYIDEENRLRGMRYKTKLISRSLDISKEELRNFKTIISEDFLLSEEGIKNLRKWIEEFEPKLVIIDSVAKVFMLNQNDVMWVRKIFSMLKPLINDFGVTFVLIHHKNKNNSKEWWKRFTITKDDVPGSREFVAQADSVFALDKYSDTSYMLKQVKNRYDKETSTINFNVIGEIDDEGRTTALKLFYDGEVKEKYKKRTEQCKEELIKWFESKQYKPFKRNNVIKVMKDQGFKESAIDSALRNLVDTCRLEKDRKNYGFYKKHKW